MSVDITYFVHGTTKDNENNISSGWSDVNLSTLGIRQSKDLKKLIKNQQFDIVFSSDLKRAFDSARLTFENDVEIFQDSRLRECDYGDLNGNPCAIVEPLQEKYIQKRFPNGECYMDVKWRIIDFLDFLKKRYAGKRVAIVAHKAPQLALEVILNGKSWEQAFASDWRKAGKWQPGWEYKLTDEILLKPNNE